MKINLCEFQTKGHCRVYFTSLLRINGTKLKLIETDLFETKKNIFFRLIDRIKLLKKFLKTNSNEKEIYHILFGDTFFYIPIFFKLYKKNKKIIMTLHNVSKNKLKRSLVKSFSKKINKIIVHSEFLKEELNNIGIKNVKIVNYPSFFSYQDFNKEKIKKEINIQNNKLIISLLGGTRKDKGYEILFESLKYLKKEYKDNILFNFAGLEQNYSNLQIEKYCKENKINYKSDIRELSDNEFSEHVFVTDIMIMPYLKTFGGNSGPMTEAIVNKIPCIAPKELNIGKIVSKNNLGETFECENPKDLARAIEKMINNISSYYTTDFYKTLTEENFLKSYEKIYQEIWREMENE